MRCATVVSVSVIVLTIFVAERTPAAPTVFTASDPTGFANSDAEFALWVNAVGGSFLLEDLESTAPVDPIASFSVNGHTFTAGSAFGLSLWDTSVAGMVPHSADTYLLAGSFANAGISPVIWELSSAAKAFGFFASDIDLGDISITFVSGGNQSFTISPAAGKNAYWGVADLPDFVQTVRITPTSPTDAVGFDDFVVAQVIPEPASMIVWGMLLAVGVTVGWRRRGWRMNAGG